LKETIRIVKPDTVIYGTPVVVSSSSLLMKSEESEQMIAPKRVSSGKYLDLAKLTVEDVDIHDINQSLNYLYRFTGHHKDKEPLTVAQHTRLCMILARDLFWDDPVVEFDCLLHDMPEAYYGDIATPLKKRFGDTYRNYAQDIDDLVYMKLWCLDDEFTPDVENKRKICDGLALDIERRNMWRDQRGKDKWPEVEARGLSLKDKEELFDLVQKDRYFDLEKEYKKWE
jgi:5'-deoxynucleotidase YfbR-like HD superfamily hydrolase